MERRPAGAVSTTVDGARERRPKVAASTTRRGSGGRRATPSTAGEGWRGRPQAELRRRANGLAKASRRRDHRRSGNAARVGGSRVRGRPGVGGVGWPGGCARLLAQPGCGLGCIVEVTGPPTGRPITFVPGRAGPRAGGAAQARARFGVGRASPGPVGSGPDRAWTGPNWSCFGRANGLRTTSIMAAAETPRLPIQGRHPSVSNRSISLESSSTSMFFFLRGKRNLNIILGPTRQDR